MTRDVHRRGRSIQHKPSAASRGGRVRSGADAKAVEAPPARMEALRYEHIGRRLALAVRSFDRLALVRLRELGFRDLRMVHVAVIKHIHVDGSRTTEVADMANMTKQAIGQLVTELEEAGYLMRTADPTDGRAKLVRFTGRGLRLVEQIPPLLTQLEGEIRNLVGDASFKTLNRSLETIIGARADLSDDE